MSNEVEWCTFNLKVTLNTLNQLKCYESIDQATRNQIRILYHVLSNPIAA